MEAKFKFYQVVVQIDAEDPKTGKIKKQKEFHLVDAADPTDLQTKVEKEMEGTVFDWHIISIQLSRIAVVY